MQVHLPPTTLASVRDLPLVRAVLCWNELELEPEELLRLDGTSRSLGWWKKNGGRVVVRSLPQLRRLYPHFPFNIELAL